MDDIDLGAALDPQAQTTAPLIPEIVEGPLPAFPFPSGFDLSPIALSLVPYERHVALMVKEAKDITVSDTESDKVALDAEGRNKKLWKDLEKERERVRSPYLAHLSKIQNIFKAIQDPLESNVTLLKKVRGDFALQEDLKRRRREAEAREEQRKLQDKLDAEALSQKKEAEAKAKAAAEKLKTEEDAATRVALKKEIDEETAAAQAPTPQAPPVVVEKRRVVRTAYGSSYTQFKWVCRVVEPDAVPRIYCEPHQKHLDDAAKGGIRQIAGCIIEEVAVPVTRV